MAKFETSVGLKELISSLSSVDISVIAPDALEAAAPIVKSKMIALARQHSRTGAMVRSIKTGKAKIQKDEYTIFTGPSGTDPDTGVRNMEKLAYLEYGVRGKQVATPVILPTVRSTRDEVLAKMQEIFNQALEKNGL